MAIDIRADVTCNLGTLISASISDDYIQGSGLIRVSGSCEISGIVTPRVGDEVTFSYTKGGNTYDIPRKLRVLSSFADPFRRTTSVSLGCKLTYLQDLTDPIDWESLDDPENAGRTADEAEIVTIPIYASSIMDKCLTELGITASSNPLTNVFSISKFDFSGGYVNILNDLLVSESYCGYLDENEILQVFSLDQEGGTGPVLGQNRIIDLGPINVGQLPGEAVIVNYSTLKLKQPEDGGPDTTDNDWEITYSETRGSVGVSYTNEDGDQAIREYETYKTTRTITVYFDLVLASGEKIRIVDFRETTERESAINILGSVATARLSNGGSFNDFELFKQTRESFVYDTKTGYEVFREKWTYGSQEYISAGAPVPWAFGPGEFVNPSVSPGIGQGGFYAGGYIDLDKERVFSKTIEESALVPGYTSSTLTITERYGVWSETIAGQQSIAEARDSFQNVGQVENFLRYYVFPRPSGLYLLDRSVNISESGVRQVAPSSAAINNAKNSDDSGNPNNGYRTDSKSELELALGSTTAQRRIEFSMPYAPDDIFIKNAGPPITYTAQRSDAIQKAQKYGRVQNKLLLGGRSGMNLQVSPEVLPSAPFQPIIVQANGLSGLYRTNGTTWTMDPSGIVASTDALFWGAVGGTGTFWFPVAPGVTTLPSTPPTVNGQMTVAQVVPVWNETVITEATVRTRLQVQTLSYALELLTEVSTSVRTQVTNLRTSGFPIPAAGTVTLNANAPQIGGGIGIFVPPSPVDIVLAAPIPRIPASEWHMRPPLATIEILGRIPEVGRPIGIYADPPAANMSVTGPAPVVPGSDWHMRPPVANVAMNTGVPTVNPQPAILTVPLTSIALAGLTPEEAGGEALILRPDATELSVIGQLPSLILESSIPLASIELTGLTPEQTGGDPMVVNIGPTDLVLAAEQPTILTGASVSVPLTNIGITSLEPSKAGEVIVDPYFNNVSLLLHFDGANNSTTMTDSSSKGQTVTAYNGAVISTGGSKFGGSSLYMTRNYLDGVQVSPTTDLDFGTGDFTVEYWYLYVSRENFNYCRVISHNNSATTGGVFRILLAASGDNGNVIGDHQLAAQGSDTLRVVGTRQHVVDGAWHHIAFCRSGGTMRCFRDGILKESATDNTAYNYGSTGGMKIGSRGDGVNNFLNGYIDDLRVTKGVARYVANFTIPSAAFPDA